MIILYTNEMKSDIIFKPIPAILLIITVLSNIYFGTAQNYDFSKVPGVVIAHYPASSKIFLGAPAICILENGDYLASHQYFGPGSSENTSDVYGSTDKGKTWKKKATVAGQFWSSLFLHDGKVYLIGTSEQFGSIVIRVSNDRGATWSSPQTPETGLLRGGSQYHCAPTPVLVHKGRIWRAFEQRDPAKGGSENVFAFLLSAPANSDLLKAENWTASEMLRADRAISGWFEGNAVASPTGEMLNILRLNERSAEYAAIIHVSDDGRLASFNAEKDIIKFPGGCKKFVIRFDEKSQRYWTLSNWVPEEFKYYNVERARNTLALSSSPDLRNWTVHSIILQDNNPEKSGFQYADWLVEDEDIIFVSRTAYFDGADFADNQHNSNFITFHRVPGFRKLSKEALEEFDN